MHVESRTLDTAELILSESQPFGDCSYIWERVCTHYRRRVEMLCGYAPAARGLLSALADVSVDEQPRVLGDPVVRAVVDGSLAHIMTADVPVPEDTLVSVLHRAALNMRRRTATSPLAERSSDQLRLDRGRSWPWMWSEARRGDDPLGTYFRHLFAQHHPSFALVTPDVDVQRTLMAGSRLLDALCPNLGPSALSHVHLVVIIDANRSPRFTSLTNPWIPGVIVLSPSVLRSPWQAAEFLLHEAMHCKFVDLEHTHSLMSEEYSADASPRLRPHWNRIGPHRVSEWPVNRALTVCHVYTCLAVFFASVAMRRAELEAEYGSLEDLDPAAQTRRAFDRAHYLRQELASTGRYLGFAGRLFIRWLGDVLRLVDPSPPPEGSVVNLLLDLYERETDELRTTVTLRDRRERVGDESALAETIRRSARNEIAGTRTALSLMGAGDPASHTLQELEEMVAALDAANAGLRESADALLAVRDSVYDTLSAVPLTEYAGSPAGRAGTDAVRRMVEESGRQLDAFLPGRAK